MAGDGPVNAQPAPCGADHPSEQVSCTRDAHHRGPHAAQHGDPISWPRTRAARRGTSNSDVRGSSYNRRRRRTKLIDAWPADVALLCIVQVDQYGDPVAPYCIASDPRGIETEAQLAALVASSRYVTAAAVLPATRCYACGVLLHAGATLEDGTVIDGTVTCDRIVPGAEGGTYAFANLRPACARHNSSTGGALGVARKAAKART